VGTTGDEAKGGIARRAMLFTDIEGSTRLARQLGEDWASALQRHRSVLRAAFVAHGGEESSREGDSFFVLFPTSDAAVRAAISGQLGLADAPWAPGAEVRVRMGIHAGEVTLADGDHVGLAIHAGARLMASAHGGQVVVSEVVAEEAGDVPEAIFRELGRFRFKDFDHPTGVFQVEHPRLRSGFPPLRATPAVNHNLAIPASTFVGREDDVVNVAAALDGHRLVTLVGAGGCGKTRLAIETASRLVDRWPDGVWLAELAEVHDALGVTSAVAVALGIAAPDAAEVGGIDAVISHLRDRTSLLVVDNCEHVIDAARDLVHLVLADCPGVRILATSRQPIGLASERISRVPSLRHAPPEFRGDTTLLATFDAGRLFLERAASAAPEYTPSDEDASAIAEICARLDGIPLAIELAAARVAVLSPLQIAGRLRRRGGIGGLGRDDARPGRQQTLEAVIDWSHDLLSERERVLLRRLSVFGTSFTLEAAEEIAGDDAQVPSDDVLELLVSLVSKSLVVLERRDAESSYRMLETVREYALSKLAEAGEAADVLRRHPDWFVLLATTTARQLPGVARVHCVFPGVTAVSGDAVSVADLQAAMAKGVDLLVIPGAARDAVGRMEFRHLAPEEPDTEWLVDELHDWRVLGAPLRVSAPTYGQLAVQAEVEPAPGARWPDVERAVRRALHRHFDPVLGGDGTGWAPGEPVDEASVRVALAGVREVGNVVAIGLFDTDPFAHALEFPVTRLSPGLNTFIYLDSCWAVRAESGPVPMVRYSASMLRDALQAVRRSEPAASIVIEGRRRGLRVTGGDERWSTRADVVGSHLLDQGHQIELSAPSTLALLSMASGRGANVDLALRDECLEVASEEPSARATLSAPPPGRGATSWLGEPQEPVVATITIGRSDLVDALFDLRGSVGDGGVGLRTDTDGLSLFVPGSSDLSRRLAASVDAGPRSGAVDLTIRRLHLALAVSSVEPGASPADHRVTLEVHEGAAVVVRSPTDPRIVHRLSARDV
jgi:predicted ATPase/class 3 adenylate cyclase